jgi:hypothetical protein
MRFSRMLNVVDAHAEGESGKVVVGGVGPVPGATMFDKMLHFSGHGSPRSTNLSSTPPIPSKKASWWANHGNRSTDMTQRRIDDWCTLYGANVEIRQQESVVCEGIVDAVTDDGKILWVQSILDGRRLFEKADFFQAWAVEERAGFHYEANRIAVNTAAKRGIDSEAQQALAAQLNSAKPFEAAKDLNPVSHVSIRKEYRAPTLRTAHTTSRRGTQPAGTPGRVPR